ncbi:MAG: alpha-galactosidase [Clostridia bacterium]|nr:alpha-galactosidase [Clostridia bacterium]
MNCNFKLTYKAGGNDCVISAPSECEDLTLAVADDGERRRVTVRAKSEVTLLGYSESGHDFFSTDHPEDPGPQGDLYFINGYQSWTETREFYGDVRERDVTRLPGLLKRNFALDRYGDATFYEYDKRVLHGYDVFYVRGKISGFAASLNLANAYLIFEVVRRTGSVAVISDVGGVTLREGDEFTVCDYIYAPSFSEGRELLKKYYPPKRIGKIFGYTSWYNYYQDINEKIILRDLSALDGRFNLFQIDDGYETFVGDWLDVDPAKFPNGLSPIVNAIKEKGLTAGIWLAPFVAEEKSRLFREKPEWFRKGPDGAPVKCGSNWSGHFALDLELPEVRDYIGKCLTHYADMGFDFFKLDFLYAASLPEYGGKTRAAAAQEAYTFLRETLGDKKILGCGATLGNAVGVFDYVRVGPDVSLKFDDAWFMKYMHRERISTKVTLQNTVFRSFMDGAFFGADPDVFLLRDDNISLSKEQRRALITLNALFGSVMMTSDNVADYDDEKKELLADSLDLFKKDKTVTYNRLGDVITIKCGTDAGELTFRYDTERGVLID